MFVYLVSVETYQKRFASRDTAETEQTGMPLIYYLAQQTSPHTHMLYFIYA